MGQLTEFFMKSPGGPPPNSGFTMPMMKGWVPRRIQPWIYVLTALCFQFSGGVYLGALDSIRGTTNLMIEDVLFLLYSTLAGMAVYFSWQMMHVFTIATMSFVLLTQVVLCRPFCPMPHRLSLKGMDFQGGMVVCGLTLVLSYIVVYGDYLMWLDSLRIRILTGIAIMLFGIMLYRLHTYRYPYVELSLFTRRNVVPILIVLDLYWLKVRKWKIWKLFGIAFISITFYAMLMYFTLDMNVNIEQYRLAIFLRGFAYAILSPALMWALNESVPSLEQFFMGLFVFNILHMYFAGAAGYGIYTTIFSHFMNENMMSYGHHLTLTRLDISHFDIGDYIAHDYLHSMMMVTIKQVYGYVIWFSLALAALFLLCDIPAVRTNIRKVPRWSVYAIDYLAKKK